MKTLNSYITESNEVRMYMGPWPEKKRDGG